MKRIVILLMILPLSGCGFLEFLSNNPAVIEAVGDSTAGMTGGIPIIKWILLALVGVNTVR